MMATYHTRRPHTAERAQQRLVDDCEAVLDLRDLRSTAHLMTDDAERQLSTQTALLLRHMSGDGAKLTLQQLVRGLPYTSLLYLFMRTMFAALIARTVI